MFKKCMLLILAILAQGANCDSVVGRSVLIDCGNQVHPLLDVMIKCEKGSQIQDQCNADIAALKATKANLYSLLRVGSDQNHYYSDDIKGAHEVEMYPAELAVLAGMPKALQGLVANGYSITNIGANTEPKLNLLAMLAYVSNSKIAIPAKIAPSFNLDQTVCREIVDILSERIGVHGSISCDIIDVDISLFLKKHKINNTLFDFCKKHPSAICGYIKSKS